MDKVTKVTWTKGQGGSRLSLGGKAVLGEGCRASCDSSRDACFFGIQKSGRLGPLSFFRSNQLAPVVVPVPVPVVIMVFVPILPHLMAIFVVAMAISVPIADLGGAAIIPVMIVSPAVVSVMVVSDAITEA